MSSTSLTPDTFPQQKGEVWQGGWFKAPFWVQIEGSEAIKPWLPLWVSTRERFAKPGEIQESKGPDEAILTLFDEAMSEIGRRPERVEVSDEGLATLLRERPSTSDIEVSRRDELEEIDHVLSSMASYFGAPDFPGALEVKGVTVDAMRRYAEAARTFYESAPWRHLSDRDLIEIRGGAPPGMSYATVLGMGGSAEGLGFFDDKTQFWSAASGEDVVDRRSVRLWRLIYGSIARLPRSEGALWVDHGLSVAGPDAYPLTLNVQSKNRVKRPSPRVLEFLTGLLAALAASSPEEFDQGRWTRVVETADGTERSYELTLPLLLEPPTHDELARQHIHPDPRAFERTHFLLNQKIQERPDSTPDEVEEMIRNELSGPIDEIAYTPKNDRERAQETCFKAFDAWGRRQTQLVEQALELDPECVDALVLKAERTPAPEEALELYERAVAAGEKFLDPEAIQDSQGDLWAYYPTRPYLRALHSLGHALENVDEADEALACFQQVLEHDESDRQFVRYCLLTGLLEAGRFRDAEDHIKFYESSEESLWQYAKALAAFGRHGDGKRSLTALGRALDANLIAAAALLNLELPPDSKEVEDALHCSHELLRPWDLTPGALEWLAEQFDAFIQ